MRQYLQAFLKEKPFFFAIVRPKEVSLYQKYKPFPKPVLDLGCGDGFFASVAFDKVSVGIDPSKEAVKEAYSRNVYEQLKPYDGKVIPYKDGYFGTIVCNSTYEHIKNIDDVLSETARVLKKGGKLYFTTVTDIWPEYLFGNLIFGNKYKRYFINKSKHYNMYSQEQWKNKLSKLGFDVTESVHYLDNKKILRIFDISHYLSAHSLLTKKLFNKWVLFPGKVKFAGGLENYIIRETKKNTKSGPYLFIAATKR